MTESSRRLEPLSVVPLYSVTVLIWGTTWIAVTFQLGTVSPAVSVAYRFALASLLLIACCLARGIKMSFPLREHAWFALQGALLSITFVCIYLSIGLIASGLVAIAFSCAVFLNILGARVFFNSPLRPRVLIAASFGLAGVSLVFVPQLHPATALSDSLVGIAFAATGTIASSLCNMAIVRSQSKGISVMQMTSLAMPYCALFSSAYALAIGSRFDFDWRASYLLSLLYLSVVGTVLVFLAYLELIRRIGAERAGYIAVAVPVVALVVSGIFEGLHWQLLAVIGLASCVFGNLLILRSAAR